MISEPTPLEPEQLEPEQLADELRPLLGEATFGFDVDGVLAPIVDHADRSKLNDGVLDALSALAARTPIVIVSGRSLESLERLFGFPASIHVVGSHGLEFRGAEATALDDDELYRMQQIELLGNKTVEEVGAGAWLERKATSMVVHTRQADQARVLAPIQALERLASMVEGVTIKHGLDVLEMMARHGDKGSAIVHVAQLTGKPTRAFFGDDVTDEDAFAALGADDVSVKIGPGPTRARFRVAGPDAVTEVLAELAKTPLAH